MTAVQSQRVWLFSAVIESLRFTTGIRKTFGPCERSERPQVKNLRYSRLESLRYELGSLVFRRVLWRFFDRPVG
jgi:hypothetical protein